jgi:hypothetical protein
VGVVVVGLAELVEETVEVAVDLVVVSSVAGSTVVVIVSVVVRISVVVTVVGSVVVVGNAVVVEGFISHFPISS